MTTILSIINNIEIIKKELLALDIKYTILYMDTDKNKDIHSDTKTHSDQSIINIKPLHINTEDYLDQTILDTEKTS